METFPVPTSRKTLSPSGATRPDMEVARTTDTPEPRPEEGCGDAPAEEQEKELRPTEVNSSPEALERSRFEGWKAVAETISSTLGTVIRDFDSRAVGVERSQDELSMALNRLTAELDKLLEDAPLPFIMQHAAKISSVHKRVSALNSVLISIQRRIDNMDRFISTRSSQGTEPNASRPS